MEKELKTISISTLKEYNFEGVVAYRDRIIMSDQFDHLGLFREPCRVDGIAIFICIRGSVKCTVNLKEYKITAGMMFVNFGSSIICVTEAEDFVAFAALVSYDCIDNIHLDFNKRISFYMGIKNNAVANLPMSELGVFQQIIALLKKNIEDKERPETEDIINNLIQLLGLTAISAMGAYGVPSDDVNMPKDVRAEQIFEHFMIMLAQTRGLERGVNYYAKALKLTPNYLSSVVKNFSGRSAADWITDFTVNEAKVLMRFSDLSVADVSEKMGFPSQSAFGKYFKQYVGVSPKQYRKQM